MSLRQWSVLQYGSVAERKRTSALLLILISGGVFFVKAEPVINPPSFFGKRAEGWHWYQDSDQCCSDTVLQKKSPEGVPLSPTQLIEKQRKELETKLHTAIIRPTRDNIIAYILAQRSLMDQSQRFSESWKQVVMTTPSLDETLVHPIDQNARHIYYDKQREERTKNIKTLAKDYGLFFFFRKNCSYCHGFSPIVKRFAEKYGWSVLGISIDGGTLPEFPYARQDNGIAERLNITHVPALIALHPQTGKLIPLAYGMVSENEIEDRIELLTRLSNTASHKHLQGGLK